MRTSTLAHTIAQRVIALHGRPRTQVEFDRMIRKVPRNRAEARLVRATGVARTDSLGAPRQRGRSLETTHRRIEADQARQAERRQAGRYSW